MVDRKEELLSIKERFNDECKNISNYVKLLKDVIELPDWQAMEKRVNILKEYNIIDNTYNMYDYKDMFLSDPNKTLNFFQIYYATINDKIEYYENYFDEINQKEVLKDNNLDETDNGIIAHPRVRYYDSKELFGEVEELSKYFIDKIKEFLEYHEKYETQYFEEYKERVESERFDLLKNKFIYEVLRYHLAMLKATRRFIDNFDLLIKINDYENILNLYRQQFIVLIASFDACVFDMVKVFLVDNFFEYIPRFNKEGKVRLQDMSKYNNFDDFKNEIVVESLKGKYIKDLLEILRVLGVSYIDEKFSNLIECVKRRNIHLHNQGRVDEKYLDSFNIFNFQKSDIATIDKQYFEDTLEICKNTVLSIYEWINDNI